MVKLRYVQGPVATPQSGGLNNTVRTVRALYETDAEIARALLPQPLVPAARPEIFLQFAHVAMHVTPETTVEIGALTLGVMCDYEGTRGGYVFHMAMEGETVVTSGRERFGEPKKIAETTFDKNGDHVRATCSRHGITYFEVEGTIGADQGKPEPFEEYFYCYKGLPSITTPGEFDGDVYLTRLNWKRNYSRHHGFDGAIRFHESAYDPIVDVPIRRMLSLDYVEGATNTSGQLLRTVPSEWIAPFWVQRNDAPSNPGVEIALAEAKAA
ncbi:acetoacetate decarboxylase family protein [Sphingomonas colocasiae]|uniref:Acetoacetate decarboxylase family protein n=1 Tax=Sphingomonas colocasiae TaxID=1848973 RepID=A0ABS7PRN4_9SPHN|nr:acetoacetate decarboxylase family protein [Sphingomonas colocasiae]MBY8824005.1 acetoacetate decarboxylase family protein [Sphingomonas colocasiae]